MSGLWPNKITGASAGGPRRFPIRLLLPARIAQFCRRRHHAIMRWFYLLAVICLLSGCAYPEPPIRYMTASRLAYEAASADHIVVTNRPAYREDVVQTTSYSLTITGQESERIIHAVSLLRTSIDNHLPGGPPSFKWQLQFYRGTTPLSTVDLSEDSILYEPWEYHAPRILRKLYRRVMKESGEKE